MAEQKLQLPHKLVLNERSGLSITGVTEVVSFDEDAVVLRTQMGDLVIHGRQLQLKTLSLEGGQVAVDGHVNAMIYQETKPVGLFRRLLG